MRQAALLLGGFGSAMGGCGTLSGGLRSESMMAATAVHRCDHPIAAALAPEQQPTGAVVEPRAGEQAMAATVAFRPASFELIRPGSQPSYMVASVGPLVVAQAPAWMLAQASPADPVVPADGILEEYDPWEPFNEKMFALNRIWTASSSSRSRNAYNIVMPERLAGDDRQRDSTTSSSCPGWSTTCSRAPLGRGRARTRSLPDQQHRRHRRPLRSRQGVLGDRRRRPKTSARHWACGAVGPGRTWSCRSWRTR